MIRIYEVMAIESGYPLFLLEHLKRFKTSISEYKKFHLKSLTKICVDLIKPLLPDSEGMNIKITYCWEQDEFSAELIKSRKPGDELYLIGATVGIYKDERINPLIKQENLSKRTLWDSICREKGFYDILLMNKNGYITEGSRSNFLLINKKNQIITSPEGVALKGITRDIIFSICKELNFTVKEKKITLKRVEKCVSMIITGTSPEILPVRCCDNKEFDVNNTIINCLQSEFTKRKMQDRYITEEIFRTC